MKEWPILRRNKNAGGLIAEKLTNNRLYPYQEMGKVTLGILTKDMVAIRGLEFSFDQELTGKNGSHMVRKFAGGFEMPLDDFGEDEATDGADVVTTLNVEMQDVVESAVAKAVDFHGAKFGVGILMEVETGEIKAIANYPEEYNHAAATLMEPGSTFKLLSVIAALEDGNVNLSDSIDLNGGKWKFYDKVMEDHAEHEGKVSFSQAFEISSNVGISRVISEKYIDHPERFIAHIDRIGLQKPVMAQTQLDHEPVPQIVRPGDRQLWSGTTLPWMSIGYNVRLTPLQVLTFYNAIANNGKMIEPILVKQVRRNADVIREYKSTVLNPSICSKTTLLQVQRMLEGVVQRGTAMNIKKADYRIAGKTGTAQIVVDGKYQERYRASFVGYFPADHPRYSLIVLIGEPTKEGFYGSSVAAPVFKAIADQIYAMDPSISNRSVNPQGGPFTLKPADVLVDRTNATIVYREFNLKMGNEPESHWITPKLSGGEVGMREVKVGSGMVPDARGMSARDAMCLLESLGLKVAFLGTGRVASQSIPAGTRLEKGKAMILTLR